MPRRIEDVYQDLTGPISLAGHPELLRLAQSVCTKIMRRAFLDDAKLRFQPGWYEDSSFSHPMLMAAQRIDILHRVCYHYRQRPQGAITRSVSPRHFEVFDQYERVFAIVDQADGRYDAFRPELFRLMINHYLVVLGNDNRLPPGMRRAFFRRIVEDYWRWFPVGGYPVPGGITGYKHRLVKYTAYPAYATSRLGYWALHRLLQFGGVGRASRRHPTSSRRSADQCGPAPELRPGCGGRE